MSAGIIFGGLLAAHSLITAIYYATVGKEDYERKALAANVEPNLIQLFVIKGVIALVGIAILAFAG